MFWDRRIDIRLRLGPRVSRVHERVGRGTARNLFQLWLAKSKAVLFFILQMSLDEHQQGGRFDVLESGKQKQKCFVVFKTLLKGRPPCMTHIDFFHNVLPVSNNIFYGFDRSFLKKFLKIILNIGARLAHLVERASHIQRKKIY